MTDRHHHQPFAGMPEDRRRLYEKALRDVLLKGYAAELEAMRREQEEKGAKKRATRSRTLRERFEDWWGDLPAASKDRKYTMAEFEAALGVPGRLISPVLMELGWKRAKRPWNGTGPYRRGWEPPPRSG